MMASLRSTDASSSKFGTRIVFVEPTVGATAAETEKRAPRDVVRRRRFSRPRRNSAVRSKARRRSSMLMLRRAGRSPPATGTPPSDIASCVADAASVSDALNVAETRTSWRSVTFAGMKR